LESCVTLSLGTIVELASKVTMRPSFLEVYQIDFAPDYLISKTWHS
jgi:hypothetical protein